MGKHWLRDLLNMSIVAIVVGWTLGYFGAPLLLCGIVGGLIGWCKWYYRDPDVLIGGDVDPYMRRWWVIPRNPYFNIYLHHFLRSDDDRALHDHPWDNMSVLLKGSYIEHMPADPKKWMEEGDRTEITAVRKAPYFYRRKADAIHRVELFKIETPNPSNPQWDGLGILRNRPSGGKYAEKPVWTLFLTGPWQRTWGFWCPKGFKGWKEYTKVVDNVNTIGEGCGEDYAPKT